MHMKLMLAPLIGVSLKVSLRGSAAKGVPLYGEVLKCYLVGKKF